MNNNQHDALFIFSLLSYHTSTCLGRISSPSSRGRMYTVYVAHDTSELTVSGPVSAVNSVAQVPFATYIHSTF
jgi:hypothetical protein